MGFIKRRLPSGEGVYQRRGKIGGFFTGVFGTLILGALASVIFTGTPIDLDDPVPPQVYSNF
ncbi:MAG: hypothetical protein AAF230_00735 [Pseudomonadota bacterium]|mgnify:CR=1 FL=1